MARLTGGLPARRALPPLLAALLLAAAPLVMSQQLAAPGDWTIVTDMSAAQGWEYSVAGPPQRAFPRLPPGTLDQHLLTDFGPQFNLLQDVSAEGDNQFTATSEQYIATVHRGYVEGESGVVYDAAGRVFHPPHFHFNRTSPLAPLPQHTLEQAAAGCEHHPVLASVVQKYGGMFYHFLEEALPRVALLASTGRLTADVKLLTWGQPYELQYLELLGVSRSQVVQYNASRVYCADRLLVATPTPRITPPREALQLVRTGLGVRTLPEEQRDLLIYVSREAEPTRGVANEDALLAAIRAAFPGQPLVVFKGDLPAAETVELFQRARLVLGPHGAGLSHILFSAPGTTVVEFLFMADPPLMFWHTAAALGQPYWLLPVPQAYWMQPAMEVPIGEVLDILAATLPASSASAADRQPGADSCQPGTYASWDSSSGAYHCTPCAAGSYAFNPGSAACKLCAPGRFAEGPGAAACRTCQPGTYSAADGASCLACPQGTFSTLPGAWSVEQCLTPEQRRQQQEDQALSVEMLSKLSPVFADQRRRLIEQGAATSGASQPSLAELCAAQKALATGSFSDPYRGPYMMAAMVPGGTAGSALLANCSQLDQPVVLLSPPAAPVEVLLLPPASVPSPPAPPVVLPPVDVPSLPPALLPPSLPMEPRDRAPTAIVESPPPQVASPSPPPAPSVYPKKKKVVDDYVIILACVLGGLLVLPLLAWLLRRCYLARQHRKVRAGVSAATAPLVTSGGYKPSTIDNAAYDAEDAASNASGSVAGSSAKLARPSPL